jgi:hypothetical protein
MSRYANLQSARLEEDTLAEAVAALQRALSETEVPAGRNPFRISPDIVSLMRFPAELWTMRIASELNTPFRKISAMLAGDPEAGVRLQLIPVCTW